MFTPVSENTIGKAIDEISATRKSVAKANSVQTLAESTDNSKASFEPEAEAWDKTWSGFQVEEYRGSGGFRLKHPFIKRTTRGWDPISTPSQGSKVVESIERCTFIVE